MKTFLIALAAATTLSVNAWWDHPQITRAAWDALPEELTRGYSLFERDELCYHAMMSDYPRMKTAGDFGYFQLWDAFMWRERGKVTNYANGGGKDCDYARVLQAMKTEEPLVSFLWAGSLLHSIEDAASISHTSLPGKYQARWHAMCESFGDWPSFSIRGYRPKPIAPECDPLSIAAACSKRIAALKAKAPALWEKMRPFVEKDADGKLSVPERIAVHREISPMVQEFAEGVAEYTADLLYTLLSARHEFAKNTGAGLEGEVLVPVADTVNCDRGAKVFLQTAAGEPTVYETLALPASPEKGGPAKDGRLVFRFRNLPAGDYRVAVKRLGCELAVSGPLKLAAGTFAKASLKLDAEKHLGNQVWNPTGTLDLYGAGSPMRWRVEPLFDWGENRQRLWRTVFMHLEPGWTYRCGAKLKRKDVKIAFRFSKGCGGEDGITVPLEFPEGADEAEMTWVNAANYLKAKVQVLSTEKLTDLIEEVWFVPVPPKGWKPGSPRKDYVALDSPYRAALHVEPLFEFGRRDRGYGWFNLPRWGNTRYAAKKQEIAALGGKVDLVMLGDSITHFWEPNDILPGRDGFEELKLLRQEFSVLDLGYSGDVYDNVVWRILHGELDGFEAKAVMLMIGTNDYARYHPTTEDSFEKLRDILRLIRFHQPNAKILLLPIFPTGAKPDPKGPRAQLNERAKAFAVDEHVIWVDFTDRFLEKDGTLPARRFPDRLHPNRDGYRIWREAITPVLRRVVGKGAPCAVNPVLPLWECVPDPEPRVFGDRLYVFGSHEIQNGWEFCLGDYVGWSCPTNDIGNWLYEGVIYAKEDDPENRRVRNVFYAPDVVKGRDGKYYLFYQRDMTGVAGDGAAHLGVAVCDRPAGRYRFHGYVKRADGTLYGDGKNDNGFDPSVLVDADGRNWLYCGVGSRGCWCYELADDMVTLKDEGRRVVDGRGKDKGTPFEGHGFVEAASARRIGDRYCLAYSETRQSRLVYATSDKPTGPFVYRGVLVDGVGFGNHGGLVELNGNWFCTWQRAVTGTSFSRQCCAEKLERDADGFFREARISSQGFNAGPLPAKGEYPAGIAFSFGGGRLMYYGEAGRGEAYVGGLGKGATLGYRSFDCRGVKRVSVTTRGWIGGNVEVRIDSPKGSPVGTIPTVRSSQWKTHSAAIAIPDGVHELYFTFNGNCWCGKPDARTIAFE